MLTCPLCQKVIDPPAATCPRCRADLVLLVDHANAVRSGLEGTETHEKARDVAADLQAYLEVLAVDPTNVEANAALAPVAAALTMRGLHGDSVPAIVAAVIGVGIIAFVAGVCMCYALVLRTWGH
ncbi:MAG: hypothetical protein U0746_11370 [Gemmataceae bacterium]